MNFHSFFCFFVFTLGAGFEMIGSIVTYLFGQHKHTKPIIQYIKTLKNIEIVKNVPSLQEFEPVWYGRGSMIQTLLNSFGKKDTDIKYTRRFIKANDGVLIALDFKDYFYPLQQNRETKPLILVLHGLGGCSKSPFIETFTDICVRKGYTTIVYIRRGHGDTSILSSELKDDQLIIPRHVNMDDMKAVVDYINEQYPNTTKFLVGFSAGSNLAVKYISEYNKPFKATISISNGYDIKNGTKKLQTSPICDGIATQFLKDILTPERIKEIKQLTDKFNIDIDINKIMKSRSLQKLEELLILPLYNIKTLEEYYNQDSCANVMSNITTPLLCIGNKNDPLVHKSMCDIPLHFAKINENIITVITDHGGHVGWIDESPNNPWYSRVVFEYLEYFKN